jgi:hypothetical protein
VTASAMLRNASHHCERAASSSSPYP